MRILIGFAFVVLAANAASAQPTASGQDIVEHGSQSGVPACSSCHGARLEGNPGIKAPSLNDRPAAYILMRLAHYAGSAGHNAMMKQVATSLTPSERIAVAGYIEKRFGGRDRHKAGRAQ